ncbi:MAG: restriction endonuclease subunit R, partial [Candidatus Cloacimonetes bacterium]|nr:restriction endonuclease subunit R [Candidatus Cloacimonadota bacterium]
DVLSALESRRKPIVLTERLEHLTILEKMFIGMCKNLIVIKGGMGKKQMKKLKERLNSLADDEERLILASGKYIGEGFDYPILDTIFLTLPISWKGTLQQYVGRIMRTHDNKDSLEVYDYIDVNNPYLVKMLNKRKSAYKSLGFDIELIKS